MPGIGFSLLRLALTGIMGNFKNTVWENFSSADPSRALNIVSCSTNTSLSICPPAISVLTQIPSCTNLCRNWTLRITWRGIQDKPGTHVPLAMALVRRTYGTQLTFFEEPLINFSGGWFRVLQYLISFSFQNWTRPHSSLLLQYPQTSEGSADGQTGLLGLSWDGFCPVRRFLCLMLLKMKYWVSVKVASLW